MVDGNIKNLLLRSDIGRRIFAILDRFWTNSIFIGVTSELNSAGGHLVLHHHHNFLVSISNLLFFTLMVFDFRDFISHFTFNPASMVLDDVVVVEVGKNFDLVKEFMDGVNDILLALVRFNFNDLESILSEVKS